MSAEDLPVAVRELMNSREIRCRAAHVRPRPMVCTTVVDSNGGRLRRGATVGMTETLLCESSSLLLPARVVGVSISICRERLLLDRRRARPDEQAGYLHPAVRARRRELLRQVRVRNPAASVGR